jgi:hypothetical protein
MDATARTFSTSSGVRYSRDRRSVFRSRRGGGGSGAARERSAPMPSRLAVAIELSHFAVLGLWPYPDIIHSHLGSRTGMSVTQDITLIGQPSQGVMANRELSCLFYLAFRLVSVNLQTLQIRPQQRQMLDRGDVTSTYCIFKLLRTCIDTRVAVVSNGLLYKIRIVCSCGTCAVVEAFSKEF